MMLLNRTFIQYGISFVESLLIALLFYVEHLAQYRPLVMRHLYTLKNEHMNLYLTPLHRGIGFFIILFVLVYLMTRNKEEQSAGWIRYKYLFISVITLFMFTGIYVKEMYVYSYALFTLTSIWGIETCIQLNNNS